MTKIQRWFLRRLLRQEVVQGPDHARRISELYGLIREAAENEFTEDNAPTMDAFLSECFQTTQKYDYWKAGLR
jgi:hypothetical protein